ncbi:MULTISPECIES: hypothetical protein [unclassified Myroides]|uniref:hypothetical protein n=1 Tax=unclassified Myroides TaxID=2642485 RepID=UPI0015FCC993|nr:MULTISPECIES: hypothetical protein [unclassified Myroides]MBB1149636.1 hypothetical protein [Myroides sp. NP-2]MDM1407108.1 hypothetical protein [Myroides sp. DF42-4-2]
MFILFQKRDFNALLSDTFTFLKVEGKNYFKHFLKLCGIPLFLVLIFIYLLADIGVTSAVSANAYTGATPESIFTEIFSEHWGMGLLALGGLFIVALIMGIICYSYPILYLKNLATATDQPVDQNSIGKQIKNQLGQIIVFFLGTSFIILPLVMIMFYISVLLVFLLVGIPILIFMLPTVYAVLTLAFYEYLTRNVGFFTAYGNAIKYVRNNFWSIIGNTFIFYIITSLITFIPSFLIQLLIVGGGMFFDPQVSDSQIMTSAVTWGIVLLYFVYIILGTLAQNIMFINQGIIFYSEREKEENFFTKRKIDSIGSNNE